MFVQVIQGQLTDDGPVLKALDDWVERLSAGADGWLGSTSGTTDDGSFVGIVCFDDEPSARRNSARPEQDDWWSRTSGLFAGDVAFHDSAEAETLRGGPSSDAGFVQVIRGRTSDATRLRESERTLETTSSGLRPDLLGLVVATHDDGTFTEVAYFSSEEDARRGEAEDPPHDARAAMEEGMSVMDDVTYLDLRRPVLHQPA
ncbi:MAG TPA: hypothetical protein VFD41_07965 [Actinomycetales bacterium]|nr:hypothetical protein [Actinomycetales bacterium]